LAQEPIDNFVITVLGRQSVEQALGPVIEVLRGRGLELDRTVKLEGGYACAELWACGRLDDEAAIRSAFRALADAMAVDIAFRNEGEYRRKHTLFCFDMDSTLIQGETIDELAKMAGVGDQVVAITASAMRGEIPFQESFRRRVGLLKGLPEARVMEVIERLPLMEGTERLFRALKARGARTAIFSGGFTFFGRVLKEKLGVDYAFANELEVHDGVVTGEVNGGIVDGTQKAELLVEIAGLEGVPLEEVVAVGDGANDLPMLGLAGMGVAFHAKPVVRASARFSVTQVGLDGLLYLLGVPTGEWK
jgi:phosphoserine phosphatase